MLDEQGGGLYGSSNNAPRGDIATHWRDGDWFSSAIAGHRFSGDGHGLHAPWTDPQNCVTAVPEPAGLALLLVGGLLMVARRRR